MVFRAERMCDLEILEMSMPSIQIVPLLISIVRRRVEMSVDFPLLRMSINILIRKILVLELTFQFGRRLRFSLQRKL